MCIIFLSDEPRALHKREWDEKYGVPRKMCSCSRRAFSIPMTFPRRGNWRESRRKWSCWQPSRAPDSLGTLFFHPYAKKEKGKETKQLKKIRTNDWYSHFVYVIGAKCEILTSCSDIEKAGIFLVLEQDKSSLALNLLVRIRDDKCREHANRARV